MFPSMDADSDENDIWDYKSVRKEKKYISQASQQETVYSRLSVKQRKKANLGTRKTYTIKKWSAQEGKLGCDTSVDVMNKMGVEESIDVDAEDESVSLYVPLDKNNKNAHTSKDNKKKSVRSSSVKRVASGSRQLGHSKRSPYTASSKPQTLNSVESPGRCESMQCPGIHKYFSPSSEKRNKQRTSLKSGRILFKDFMDDELLIVQEEIVAKKQIKLSESVSTDHVCNTSSRAAFDCSMKSNEHFSHSTEQKVCLYCKDVRGNSRAAVEERVVCTDTINIEHRASDGNTSSLAASLESGYNSCVEKLQDSLMTSHDQLACPASVTSGSGFLVDAGECDVEGNICDNSLRDRCELQTSSSSGEISDYAQTECGGHLPMADISDLKSSQLSHANIAQIVEDMAIIKTSPNVGTNSPSLRAQARSPSVTPQAQSPSAIDKQSIQPGVQKQTSIFSFFKARVGSSCKTTGSTSNQFSTLPGVSRGQISGASCKTTGSTSNKFSTLPGVSRRQISGASCKTTGSTSNKFSTLPGVSRRQISGASCSKVSIPPGFNHGQTLSLATPVKGRNSSMQHLITSTSCTDVGAEPELPQDRQQHSARPKRQCPFYKKIHNTGITVDAFSYGVVPGCQAYILTHFHYDHYGGLTKKFAQPIYCSQVTGNLVEHRLGVNKMWINRLQLWIPYQVAGVTLTLIEANHCPGAVMVLFELKDGKTVLHTGDFRACPEMEKYPVLKRAAAPDVYLDTTYCDPSYTFPTQSDVINFALSLVLTYVTHNPHTLIICGTYTIGKEKIFKAIAEALNSKICVTRDKKKVLDCLNDEELQARLTLDWSQGQVHVLPMGKLKQQALFEHHACHPKFTSVLALEPTGWSHSNRVSLESLSPKWSRNNVTLYGIPYSEHSSYQELKRFIEFLRPKKIIPTVNNGSPASRKKMEDIFRSWT